MSAPKRFWNFKIGDHYVGRYVAYVIAGVIVLKILTAIF